MVVDGYYAAAPHEPTQSGLLPVSGVRTFRPTFLHLVEAILAWRRSHVIVVSHGTADVGLLLPLAPETDTWCASAFDDLRGILDNWDSEGALNASRVSDFASNWSLQLNSVQRLVAACHRIRHTLEVCVALHVRGCNIGGNIDNLRALRQLLGCALVSAPKCPMFYAAVFPHYGGFDNFLATHAPLGRRFMYEDASAGKLLLDVDHQVVTVTTQAAVETQAAIAKWAKLVTQNPNAPGGTSFKIAGFFPDGIEDYYLAHDEGYVSWLEELGS